ncbi:MAG: TPM domain-containing protein, partial [Gemmatimonadales bacterium]
MEWRKATRALVVLQLVPALLAGQDRGARGLFPAQPTGYLTDAAGVVDPASAAAIEDLASRLRSATGAELAVVTLPTL